MSVAPLAAARVLAVLALLTVLTTTKDSGLWARTMLGQGRSPGEAGVFGC